MFWNKQIKDDYKLLYQASLEILEKVEAKLKDTQYDLEYYKKLVNRLEGNIPKDFDSVFFIETKRVKVHYSQPLNICNVGNGLMSFSNKNTKEIVFTCKIKDFISSGAFTPVKKD